MKSVIYIVSPYYKTGGPKSLHQLANVLVEKKYDVYMVYYCNGEYIKADSILFDFCKAKITEKEAIIDKSENKIIVSEYDTGILLDFKQLEKYVWWLSLDYYRCNKLYYYSYLKLRKKSLPKILLPFAMIYKGMIKKDKRGKYLKFNEFKNMKHMYNCEYIHRYLLKKGIPEENTSYLCGPLEENYNNINKENILEFKENIVLYNPAKINKKFLRKIYREVNYMDKTIKFIPIQNMTRDEVYNTLKKAKVYIDFGYFPGPERMPREAVSLYCNIITSKLGSAANDIDVPITDNYKFEMNNQNVYKVANLIIKMCNNYEQYINDFDVYRIKVKSQIDNFEKNAYAFISK